MNANPPPLPRLRPCPDCQREVSYRAENCPHCGCPIAAQDMQKIRAMQEARAAEKKGMTPGAMIMAAVLVLALIGFCAALYQGVSASANDPGANMMAWHMSCEFVERRLSPKPAKFPNPRSDGGNGQSENADGSFDTWGSVDSVNGFNSPTRFHWRAKVKPSGDEKWQCLSLTID